MRRIAIIVGLLSGLTVAGTVGLRLITAAPWLDCLYMAVITLTTVGYKEEMELGPGGKVFIIVYLIACLGIFTYSAFQLGQWIVSADLRSLLEKRRMDRAIARLNRHYIVCGLGRMGTTICRYLHDHRKPFVAIDLDERRLVETCADHGWIHVAGDATNDEVLRRAGIERARSLTSALPTDADNVYVVLSARMLNAGLQIVARATDEKAIEKMQRAGATRVVSPFSSGAIKMARFMLNPNMEDFLEIADRGGSGLELAEVDVPAHSPWVGKQIGATDLSDRGVMVIGIRRANGERLVPPPAAACIESGDCLFAFGNADAVNAMIDDAGERD